VDLSCWSGAEANGALHLQSRFLKSGGRFTAPSKVPVPSDHKSPKPDFSGVRDLPGVLIFEVSPPIPISSSLVTDCSDRG
jgi:hypothetical protein